MAPRHDAGLHKVSLHPPGWRWAYTERHPTGPGDLLPEGQDRCLYRFNKPPFIGGAQFAFAFAFAIGIQPHGPGLDGLPGRRRPRSATAPASSPTPPR